MTQAGSRTGTAPAAWVAAATLLAFQPAAAPATAQVSVNPGALDSLGSTPAPNTPRRPAPARPAPRRPAQPQAAEQTAPPQTQPSAQPQTRQNANRNNAPRPAPGRTAPAVAAPPPVVAPAPPPVAAIPPPVVVPVAPAAPPAPVPVVDTAVGEASTLVGGIRITFGPDSSDLNPATATALRTMAHSLAPNERAAVNVIAYAAAAAEDPSTPRRVSLSRALAARSVLISEGIASSRIYVRALGPNAADGPPDRVDVVQVGLAAQPGATPGTVAR